MSWDVNEEMNQSLYIADAQTNKRGADDACHETQEKDEWIRIVVAWTKWASHCKRIRKVSWNVLLPGMPASPMGCGILGFRKTKLKARCAVPRDARKDMVEVIWWGRFGNNERAANAWQNWGKHAKGNIQDKKAIKEGTQTKKTFVFTNYHLMAAFIHMSKTKSVEMSQKRKLKPRLNEWAMMKRSDRESFYDKSQAYKLIKSFWERDVFVRVLL